MKAVAIHGGIAAMVAHNCLTIFEAQQEFEGEQGSVVPAKSIWMNTTHAKTLRDFLNEEFPTPEAAKYKAVIGALQYIIQYPDAPNITDMAMKALEWEAK